MIVKLFLLEGYLFSETIGNDNIIKNLTIDGLFLALKNIKCDDKNFLIDKKSENVYFLPLGGSGEIGMNLNLYGYQNKWLIIDCGVSFRDSNIIGADVFMPNIDAY